MDFLSFVSVSMQKANTWDTAVSRPTAQNTKSFSRFEGSSPVITPEIGRSRAATLSGSSPKLVQPELVAAVERDEDDSVFTKDEVTSPTLKAPESFDELPIEIRSLTERFLESLTAPVHPTPLTIDTLSDLFQEFYTKAESHIAAHIAALSTKIGREKSPASSVASRVSNASKNGQRLASPVRKASGEQQMLTALEITDRKKARRLLELKKTAWDEIVERTVVERVYNRIYRHRSADDEERDQKLRSRIAALSLVGIGLKELLDGADDIPDDMRRKTVEEQDHIRDLLSGARQHIQDMDAEKHPLGKLQHLTLAHKAIVETLSQLFPSSSSADEILPTLIYALITSEPATVNVVSNLKFIQRFRAASKVDGEAAYCLVNLEAATSFLETVDLTSLRADEKLAGPEKSSRPTTPRTISTPMSLGIVPADNPSLSADSSPGSTKPLPSPSMKQQRRLSNLLSSSSNRLNEASDSLRGVVLDSADQAFDSIHNTLDSSFKFLFGRMREHQAQSGNEVVSETVLPKTLEDARKLVSSPPPILHEEGDDASINTSSSVPDGEDPLSKPANERITEIFAGRKQMRDRSVDSQRSGGSNKRVAFESTLEPPTSSAPASSVTTPSAIPSNAAVESMRNFGQTINPLNQLSKVGGFFARSGSVGQTNTPPGAFTAPPPLIEKPTLSPSSAGNRGRSSSDVDKATAAVEVLKRMAPPNKKFIECKDARDLRLGEVEELLKEYQRLVGVLGRAVASV